ADAEAAVARLRRPSSILHHKRSVALNEAREGGRLRRRVRACPAWPGRRFMPVRPPSPPKLDPAPQAKRCSEGGARRRADREAPRTTLPVPQTTPETVVTDGV